MYEKILVAIDQSPVAQRVLAAARELAQLAGGEVFLREREYVGRGGGLTSVETGDEARELVDKAVAALQTAGSRRAERPATRSTATPPGRLSRTPSTSEPGVIVMGSRGHGDLAGLVLGSTAHKVIHLTDRPVLIVR